MQYIPEVNGSQTAVWALWLNES